MSTILLNENIRLRKWVYSITTFCQKKKTALSLYLNIHISHREKIDWRIIRLLIVGWE